ncbi:hypothetical protein [Siphonobacter aquaeclarae]|uniref:Uncharacterized protein n=1 Tax=Siphonobacter aquaeclarae TaxID=563176 RepID=A0A1G9KCP2_9BACT|nr:hypothetical protein [Siphonobacter aquaeclarae]SDL47447.1 hypothetical protein SAMN04488090_0970 [Siphonobacter aquaeclarae]
MKKLQQTWLTDGLLDFEYKKYLLLAYLKHVEAHFGQQKIFPELSDLQVHYRESMALRQSQAEWAVSVQKKLAGIDWEHLRLKYENEFAETESLREVEEILTYAIPRFGNAVRVGEELLEEIANRVTISPVGIVPLFRKEGYLFLYQSPNRELQIYTYRVTLFDSTVPPSRRVVTDLVESRYKSSVTTFESIKLELVRKRKEMPNPASYVVESTGLYPMEETFLPIARRKIAAVAE